MKCEKLVTKFGYDLPCVKDKNHKWKCVADLTGLVINDYLILGEADTRTNSFGDRVRYWKVRNKFGVEKELRVVDLKQYKSSRKVKFKLVDGERFCGFCDTKYVSRPNNPNHKYCPKCSREQQKAARLRLKEEIFGWYGRVCVCCLEKEIDFLTLDHINDDAVAQGRNNKVRNSGTSLGGMHLYRKIHTLGYENRPKDLQILCMNCQFGKRLNNGFCPHHDKTNLGGPLATIENTINNLKKHYEEYSKEVKKLTAEKKDLDERLQNAILQSLRLMEGISALEGKPSLGDILNKTSEQLGEAAANETLEAVVALADTASSPENGNLPAPEPGFQWAKSKNELGDLIDVLVPLAHPSETNTPRIAIPLPPIGGYDNFADPSSFIG